MDVFAAKALIFIQFVRPVAKFVRREVEMKAGKTNETRKLAEVPSSLPLPTS